MTSQLFADTAFWIALSSRRDEHHRRAVTAFDPQQASSKADYVAPRNGLEEQLAAIWSEVLGLSRVGIHDDFFDLGGHSLLAVRLVAEIEKTLQKKLPLAALFQLTTISELAGMLEPGQRKHAALKEIMALIDPPKRSILVDDNRLGVDLGGSRIFVPFLERNGEYWGPPADDEIAIREFERLRCAGADYIVFGFPVFWWLDYYSRFDTYLRTTVPCVFDNEWLIVFDLESPQLDPSPADGHRANVAGKGR